MTRKLTTQLIIVTILLALTGLGFFMVEESETEVSINGAVCNQSSAAIWLTVSTGERHKIDSLAPGGCTDFFTQDVEAIWGSDCSTNPCHYQAWKVSAGRFIVYDEIDPVSGSVLRIKGWGAGSRWHITGDWPKPELASIGYSLVR